MNSLKINGHTFLAFANYKNGRSHSIDSFIYKWDGNKFVLFKSIPTHGATAWHPFVMCGQTYLGVANLLVNKEEFNTHSVVYQFPGETFVKYQEFPTQGAFDMTSFKSKVHIYLVITNFQDGDEKNINSTLYKWKASN